jgi:hypothetical protein
MLYQLSYASPDSLILLFSRDTKASPERGVQIERLPHAEPLCNALRGRDRGHFIAPQDFVYGVMRKKDYR